MDPGHAMNCNVTWAQQLGISVDVFARAGSSGCAPGGRDLADTKIRLEVGALVLEQDPTEATTKGLSIVKPR